MKKSCFLFLVLFGFAISGFAQSVTNNSTCDINVSYGYNYVDPVLGCTSTGALGGTTLTPVSAGGTAWTFPPPPPGQWIILHFVFPGTGCSVFDPFVSDPGNCFGLPLDDVIQGNSCTTCPPTANVTNVGGLDWDIN